MGHNHVGTAAPSPDGETLHVCYCLMASVGPVVDGTAMARPPVIIHGTPEVRAVSWSLSALPEWQGDRACSWSPSLYSGGWEERE